MTSSVFIRGDSVTLRTIESEDLEFLKDVINDPEVREGMVLSRPTNSSYQREYFEEQVSNAESVDLAIYADEEIVGRIGLHDIEQESGSAEIGLRIHPDYHGNGYGTEASRLLTTHAFDELRLHRLQARVLADNEPSHRVWEKLGYELDGVHRDEFFSDGEYVDLHYYSALSDEWQA